MTTLPQPSQTSVEFNLRWADENPALMVKRLREFAESHPEAEWTYAADFGRPNYVTFTAKRKGA